MQKDISTSDGNINIGGTSLMFITITQQDSLDTKLIEEHINFKVSFQEYAINHWIFTHTLCWQNTNPCGLIHPLPKVQHSSKYLLRQSIK